MRIPPSPGSVILQVLKKGGLRQTDLARATGYSTKHINQIIQGKAKITPEVALALEESLGDYGHHTTTFVELDAEFWCYLQTKCDLTQLRADTDYKTGWVPGSED